MMSLTFIFDVSSVTVFISFVGNELSATIGERDPVRSGGDLTISVLRMDKVVV
jgi:hypothetical protein